MSPLADNVSSLRFGFWSSRRERYRYLYLQQIKCTCFTRTSMNFLFFVLYPLYFKRPQHFSYFVRGVTSSCSPSHCVVSIRSLYSPSFVTSSLLMLLNRRVCQLPVTYVTAGRYTDSNISSFAFLPIFVNICVVYILKSWLYNSIFICIPLWWASFALTIWITDWIKRT